MSVMNWLKKYGYIILWTLLGIIFSGWVVFTTVLLWGDQQLASAYIAIGTLILASATILLALLSWQNIKSGYDKEKRDRRERWLNEIIGWAVEIGEYRTEEATADYFGVGEFNIDKAARLKNLVKKYEITLLTGESVKNLATRFGEDLTSNVNNVIKNINEAIKATIKYIDKKDDTNIAFREMYLHWSRELEKSITVLIKEATKIKTAIPS